MRRVQWNKTCLGTTCCMTSLEKASRTTSPARLVRSLLTLAADASACWSMLPLLLAAWVCLDGEENVDTNAGAADRNRMPMHRKRVASRGSPLPFPFPPPLRFPTMSTSLTDRVNASVDSTLEATESRMGIPLPSCSRLHYIACLPSFVLPPTLAYIAPLNSEVYMQMWRVPAVSAVYLTYSIDRQYTRRV